MEQCNGDRTVVVEVVMGGTTEAVVGAIVVGVTQKLNSEGWCIIFRLLSYSRSFFEAAAPWPTISLWARD